MTTQGAATFGELLRRYRLAVSLSQEALAERAQLSRDAIRALERGRRNAPRRDTLALLATALELVPADRDALVAAAAGKAPPAEAPPTSSLAPALPTPPTALIGREHEEAAVTHLLRQGARLLTLTGPGGVGKTRLALAVAAAMRDVYRDGAAFVDLSALRDPALVPAAAARGLGVREVGARDVSDLLLAHLRSRQMLLVLDNAEQVLEAALWVAELVAHCPLLVVLVTSRTPLHVRAEQRFRVPPLATPRIGRSETDEIAGYAAVRLFMARARAAQPDFGVDASGLAVVGRICARLEGLPLAIELAASRVTLLSPPALLERLEQAGGARLRLLARGAPDLPARQQTLRATIDWSYELLTPREQTLFRRLAVFSGGATLEAIEAICLPDSAAEALEEVASLTDKSLLRWVADSAASEPRITMLDMPREYAWERLKDDEEAQVAALHRRHAAHYLALAEAAKPELTGPRQQVWLDRLEAEHDNLRAALRWASGSRNELGGQPAVEGARESGDAEVGLRVSAALWRFWWRRGYLSEGRRWLEAALAQPGTVAPRLRADALRSAGILAYQQGDLERAVVLCEQSLALYTELGDPQGSAGVLNSLGNARREQGDYRQADALYEQSLALYRAVGDTLGIAVALNNRGTTAHHHGDLDRAAALYDESLAIRRERGDTAGIAYTLEKLGAVVCEQGDVDRARDLCAESLALCRELGDKVGSAAALDTLATAAREQRDDARARALYEESLALYTEVGERWGIATVLRNLGVLTCQQGEGTRAAAYGAESLKLLREIGDRRGIAATLALLGRAALLGRDHAQAAPYLEESLALYKAIGDMRGAGAALAHLGEAAHGEGDDERAESQAIQRQAADRRPS